MDLIRISSSLVGLPAMAAVDPSLILGQFFLLYPIEVFFFLCHGPFERRVLSSGLASRSSRMDVGISVRVIGLVAYVQIDPLDIASSLLPAGGGRFSAVGCAPGGTVSACRVVNLRLYRLDFCRCFCDVLVEIMDLIRISSSLASLSALAAVDPSLILGQFFLLYPIEVFFFLYHGPFERRVLSSGLASRSSRMDVGISVRVIGLVAYVQIDPLDIASSLLPAGGGRFSAVGCAPGGTVSSGF
ncbi:hypothetical protein F2Q69_00020050 [Brassica cretica]|uniref:Uncharacterized protein n=1 Tax=Brassica cretica TaxID=69181 RepID=A0A8S9QNC4_BRACR|nr:hypothetical protein F2Q69_00020050 [Brassica cretica]